MAKKTFKVNVRSVEEWDYTHIIKAESLEKAIEIVKNDYWRDFDYGEMNSFKQEIISAKEFKGK